MHAQEVNVNAHSAVVATPGDVLADCTENGTSTGLMR